MGLMTSYILSRVLLIAGEAAEGGAGHGESQPHIPNLLTFINESFANHYEVPFYALLMAVILMLGAFLVYRKRQLIPGPFQNAVEMLVEALYDLVYSMLGKEADRYVPFLGTLFLYIWFMNLMGIIPFFHSPTSSINLTAALGLSVFLYVQFTALTRLGPLRYLMHLMGDPASVAQWILVPILLPVHIIGELVKPVSLSLRLFGNILGEDILVATMVGLGILALSFMKSPVGFPFQIPFYFLAMLTSTIQALVFTMLSTSYFMMVLPHGEHDSH
jgi:F-type H+-transporting ATPase subunit a